MYSSAFGAAARMVLRSFSSAARLSSLTAARYSSMVFGFAAMKGSREEEHRGTSTRRHRRQQLRQLVVPCGHALFHRGLEHRVACCLRRIPDRVRQRRLAALFDEDERTQRLAACPILVEQLGADDPFRRRDLAMNAAHPHL